MSETLTYFPYDTVRPQQQQIMNFIQRTLDTEDIAIIEAATGVGKTVAALSPLLEYITDYNSMNQDKLKLVIVGRTHSQADRVITELNQMTSKRPVPISAVAKRGKQSLCINKEVKYQPASQFQAVCNAYKKAKQCQPFINSMIPSRTEFVAQLHNQPVNSDEIIELATLHNCCPAEITNKIIKDVDVIACSYHYLFSETIRSRFLQLIEVDLDQLVVVVDECHNLPDATVQMNALRVSLSQLNSALLEIRKSPLSDELEPTRDRYVAMIQSLVAILSAIDDEFRVNPLQLLNDIEDMMRIKGYNEILRKEIVEEIKNIAGYILANSITKQFTHLDYIVDLFDMIFTLIQRKDQLIIFSTYNDQQYIETKIMDPSQDIYKVLQFSHHSTLMTGTLGHPFIFRAQCGLFNNTQVLQLPSPYKQDLGVFQVNSLTSKYTERNKVMYQNYVKAIHEIVKAEVNTGLYVTSYTFLDKLFEHGLDQTKTQIFRAKRSMNSKQTEMLIEEFRQSKQHGGLLCSVMGGRSAEGTDFPNDEMEIVIVAGVPYPPKTLEQEAKFEYYDKKTEAAWNICYTTPAFRSINQAAGRAVRSLSDRALVFLLDDRIVRNKQRLTGWLSSSFETIEIDEIHTVVTNYFT